jgi:hypothetical protein
MEMVLIGLMAARKQMGPLVLKVAQRSKGPAVRKVAQMMMVLQRHLAVEMLLAVQTEKDWDCRQEMKGFQIQNLLQLGKAAQNLYLHPRWKAVQRQILLPSWTGCQMLNPNLKPMVDQTRHFGPKLTADQTRLPLYPKPMVARMRLLLLVQGWKVVQTQFQRLRPFAKAGQRLNLGLETMIVQSRKIG